LRRNQEVDRKGFKTELRRDEELDHENSMNSGILQLNNRSTRNFVHMLQYFVMIAELSRVVLEVVNTHRLRHERPRSLTFVTKDEITQAVPYIFGFIFDRPN